MPTLLFISPSAYPLGGVATWMGYLARGLPERGWNVVVGLVSGTHHDVAAYLREHHDFSSVEISNRTGSYEGRIRALVDTLSATRPDIVLGVNIADVYEAVSRVRLDGSLPELRCVMTNHGIQPDLFEDVARECARIDAIACSNKLAVEIARQCGASTERLFYVPYGVPQARERALNSSEGASDCVRIAYVGRLEQWQKRVLDLAPICDALEAREIMFLLTIAGTGPDEPALREALKHHSAAGRVKWLGAVAADDVAHEVYADADILLNLSLWETGPIVIWEAMSHGVAVLSTRYIGSGREGALVDRVNCCLFDIGDTDAAATLIAEVSNRQVREALVEAGLQLVESRYSVDASVTAWHEALQSVLRLPVVQSFSTPTTSTNGRLDRVFGAQFAETIRRIARRSFVHTEAGGEWPHSLGGRPLGDPAFWEMASRVDTRSAQ